MNIKKTANCSRWSVCRLHDNTTAFYGEWA